MYKFVVLQMVLNQFLYVYQDYLKSLGIKSDEDVSLILEYALTVADAAITNDDDDNDKTESNHASNNNNSKNNHRGK